MLIALSSPVKYIITYYFYLYLSGYHVRVWLAIYTQN